MLGLRHQLLAGEARVAEKCNGNALPVIFGARRISPRIIGGERSNLLKQGMHDDADCLRGCVGRSVLACDAALLQNWFGLITR